MNSEEIKRLVAKSENAAVEFKWARGVTAAQAGLAIRASQAEAKARPSVPADFWPSYSSFANTDGGVFILGVREKEGKCEIEALAAEVYVGEKRSVFAGDKLPFGGDKLSQTTKEAK